MLINVKRSSLFRQVQIATKKFYNPVNSWKRPYELAPNGEPKLYVDGTSRRDVIQVPIPSN